MSEYWVIGEERVGGIAMLRKLASAKKKELAKEILDAIVAGEAYDKVYLVEVLEKV